MVLDSFPVATAKIENEKVWKVCQYNNNNNNNNHHSPEDGIRTNCCYVRQCTMSNIL
jgi:hypothetical protein